ncbi:MAG: hypothetical protein SF029_00670 [bacterium]|nr:hypothetical protein [bacterium]
MFIAPGYSEDEDGSKWRYSNLRMVEAIVCTAEDLGLSGLDLMKEAGIDQTVRNTKATYSGPAVDDLPNLSHEIKQRIKHYLKTLPGHE